MKWFQRDAPEDGADFEAYSAHLSALEPRLTAGLRVLARTNLHDALIESVSVDEASRHVVLCLLGGDLQVGYFRLRCAYSGATIKPVGADLRWLVNSGEVQLLHDEIDGDSPDAFAHRLLFWPAGELHIQLGDVELERQPAATYDRRPSSERLYYR